MNSSKVKVTSSRTDFSDRVLLTIHGITSDNAGLALLRDKCEKELPGLIADSYFYGHVVPFKDLSEATRQLIFQSVREKIELMWLRHINGNGKKLFIVAHSFGTLAVVRALEMHIPTVAIDGLILLGSVVPRVHFWDGLIDSGQLLHPPLVVIRPMDSFVRLGRLVEGGESGARGFIANGRYRPYETYKDGGHTAYYPDDVGDIIAALKAGVSTVPRTSYEDWYRQCSSFRKLRLFAGRVFLG